MKAITLWQPWASLIAYGVKTRETRSRPFPAYMHGERIAIHAAKRPVQRTEMIATNVMTVLPPEAWKPRAPHALAYSLPLGAVVATAVLGAAIPTEEITDPDQYGDYSPSRWAWLLADIERLEVPVPARGYQGWWEWDP